MPLTNVPRLLNTIVADLQSDAWSRGVRVVADTSTEIAIDIDTSELRAAITDVVGTLVKLMPRGASLSIVSGFDAETEAALMLQIYAPAVAPDRVASAVDRLTMCVRQNGGEVSGRAGADFWTLEVRLPRAQLLATPEKRRTVLVVDDDVDTQEFLRLVLEDSGYRVIPVNDGFDALVAIERYAPDVVLTDVLMPNMNGIDLVARIRDARSGLPVIVFSGYRDVLVNNIAGLPDRILPKPMTRDDVLAAVDDVLARPRA
jgi:CheY-like chemotaxis protein